MRPLSVLMNDTDHFKDVNDHYGHPAGDQVIWAIANVLVATSAKAMWRRVLAARSSR